MHEYLNPLVKQIEPSRIRAFSDMAARYEDVISLTIGQPDFLTPDHIKIAGCQAISENWTTYPPSAGYYDLLKAACSYVESKYQQIYCPESEVLITNGATQALYIALCTILQAGDEVILPAPIYSGYEPIITLCGAQPVYIDTRNTGFKLRAEDLQSAITTRTKCIILSYPMNPTGVTLSKEDIHQISEVLADQHVFVLSDEIYSELTYDMPHNSIFQNKEMRSKTIIVNGVSKSHAMTGWRVGMVFAPEYITEQMKKIHQYSMVSVSSISQMAAIEALTTGIQDPQVMQELYMKRRDYVYERLCQMNLEVIKPEGAFYFFPSIQRFGKNSMQFCEDLLKNARVAVIPGSAFSDYGEGYIRLSFACSMPELEHGLNRLESYISAL